MRGHQANKMTKQFDEEGQELVTDKFLQEEILLLPISSSTSPKTSKKKLDSTGDVVVLKSLKSINRNSRKSYHGK